MISNKKLFLIFIPAILIVGLAFFIQIIKYQPLFPKVNPEDSIAKEFVIPLYPQDPIIGNAKAPLTIVAFEDFSCESCSGQSAMLENLLQKYPNKFKVLWKSLPVSEFPYPSINAVKYGYCANEQKKFLDFKASAFVNSSSLSETILQSIAEETNLDDKKLSKCLNSTEVTDYIDNNKQIAKILNIQAVPAFFINNKQIENPKAEYQWEEILELTQ
ncbi:MAG: thioredoxin domain-containing protein [Patescibacteria group bacterium]|nr:thioredoxin domain-containing protein [Patescibacteria group bacterium]